MDQELSDVDYIYVYVVRDHVEISNVKDLMDMEYVRIVLLSKKTSGFGYF
jgi:hypothetical protein